MVSLTCILRHLRSAMFAALLAAGMSQIVSAQERAGPKFDTSKLPPPAGAETPLVAAKRTDDGLYTQTWFGESFLNLRDDFEEARKNGKRFVVIFEQRGCIYCIKLHTEALAKRYINDYARENFRFVQLNMWGDREVTDFDGTVMTEKKLAQRWGVIYTPTIIFLKADISTLSAKWGPQLEITRLNQVGAGTIYDMLTWVKHKLYEQEPNFQRFHIQRIDERQALSKTAPAGKTQ